MKNSKVKKVGIITFHNAYNCGSMLESFAIQQVVSSLSTKKCVLIDYSSPQQRTIYQPSFKPDSMRNILKDLLIFPFLSHIEHNNSKYLDFQNKFLTTSAHYDSSSDLNDEDYSIVIAGSDQIWNITIADHDDAYFLNWVKTAKKIAYAPSFGSKNIQKYTNNPKKYADLIKSFDALSVRENNGRKWIKELTGADAPVLLDPTLLLAEANYENLISDDIELQQGEYIFFYSPGFSNEVCRTVRKISKTLKLPVITWSARSFATRTAWRYGFKLAKYENPSSYLFYIKNAKLVLTTSYHGTVFSTIFKKDFFTIKNGGMFGDDDRVITLLEQLNLEERLLDSNVALKEKIYSHVDYTESDKNLKKLRAKSLEYLRKNLNNDEVAK